MRSRGVEGTAPSRLKRKRTIAGDALCPKPGMQREKLEDKIKRLLYRGEGERSKKLLRSDWKRGEKTKMGRERKN